MYNNNKIFNNLILENDKLIIRNIRRLKID
jgi:hypothetical protein